MIFTLTPTIIHTKGTFKYFSVKWLHIYLTMRNKAYTIKLPLYPTGYHRKMVKAVDKVVDKLGG